jgi:hypothetical protein
VEKEITEIVKGRPAYLMMSRPDAIVRDRETGEIVVISWKTIDDVTSWRRLFFKQDLQGMMEAHYSEQFLHAYSMLHGCQSAKVSYVQTIYLVKGKRTRKGAYGEDGEGDVFADETMGDEWRQDSFLVYPYTNRQPEALTVDDVARLYDVPDDKKALIAENARAFESLAWKYRYTKPGNVSFSTLGKSYSKTLVTNTSMSVREWVKALHERAIFPSTLPMETESPLSKTIIWEAPSYRDEALMRSIIAQVKESERKRHRDKKVIERVQALMREEQSERAYDALASHEYTLDKLFPQQLTSCSFPWKCQFSGGDGICFNTQKTEQLHALNVPDGFVRREAHHEPEMLWQIENVKVTKRV